MTFGLVDNFAGSTALIVLEVFCLLAVFENDTGAGASDPVAVEGASTTGGLLFSLMLDMVLDLSRLPGAGCWLLKFPNPTLPLRVGEVSGSGVLSTPLVVNQAGEPDDASPPGPFKLLKLLPRGKPAFVEFLNGDPVLSAALSAVVGVEGLSGELAGVVLLLLLAAAVLNGDDETGDPVLVARTVDGDPATRGEFGRRNGEARPSRLKERGEGRRGFGGGVVCS